MNILRIAGELFLLYLLYKLIFDFIIPIYHTTKKVKQQFGEMHQKMEDQMKQNGQQQQGGPAPKSHETVSKDDYIEYEEVK